jgi:hypothetical protein
LVGRLATIAAKEVVWFTEEDAAKHAFVAQLKADEAVSERQLAACREVAGILEALRKTDGISHGLVADLIEEQSAHARPWTF